MGLDTMWIITLFPLTSRKCKKETLILTYEMLLIRSDIIYCLMRSFELSFCLIRALDTHCSVLNTGDYCNWIGLGVCL